jgi:hypothetical protein
MPRKPNYRFERAERERSKAAKKAEREKAKRERSERGEGDAEPGDATDDGTGETAGDTVDAGDRDTA